MKSFKAFLLEHKLEFFTPLSKTNTREILAQYESPIEHWVKSGARLYRGISHIENVIDPSNNLVVGIGDATKLNRKPLDAKPSKFYYHWLFSGILPSWNGWPQRNNSFSCSTEYAEAKSYSKYVFHVIPLEYQKIAVCRDNDFWFSFTTGLNKYFENIVKSGVIGYLPSIKMFMEMFAYNVIETIYGTDKISKTEYKKFLMVFNRERAEEFLKRDIDLSFKYFIMDFLKSNKQNLFEFFNEAFSPQVNGFRLLSKDEYGELEYVSDSIEVWMSGKVLFVEANTEGERLRRVLDQLF